MDLKETHTQKRDEIEKRLQDFSNVYLLPDEEIFGELCFCLFTPQSKAKSCWRAIEKLKETGSLYNGDQQEIKKWMAAVRFNENKSKYVIEARRLFTNNGKIKVKEKLERFNTTPQMRSWLLENVKGYGMKEASHFLRNIGFGDDIAILDRHILKNMVRHGVISEIPKSITEKKYLEMEAKLRKFSRDVGIPMAHLDLLWWSEEAGEIFK